MYVHCKSENHLAVACLEKNLEFRLLIVAKKRIIFFKYSLFQNFKELFKSNETHSWNSSWHVDFNAKRISDRACVEKKLVLSLFSYEIGEFIFFTYSFFSKRQGIVQMKRNS